MTRWSDPSALDSIAPALTRARVEAVLADGRVEVDLEDDATPSLICEVLQTANGPALSLARDDRVLLWVSPTRAGDAVVLGRVGASHSSLGRGIAPSVAIAETPIVKPDDATGYTPDTVVLEAKHSLTLRVGDGSITIREDGKILIKGKDLVSHAQRMNRIKGGAVSIN